MFLKVVLFLFVIFSNSKAKYFYKTEYINLPVDHFSYANNNTFKLRYLINDTYWSRGEPIFFYTGNEGDITLFAENTGFMWEISEKFKAMIIFAEHRYYGETMPFGNKSFSEPKYLGYLSSTQALADYVYLIENIQERYNDEKKSKRSPVIAFGGSYGGMLAAWIRLKYPSSVFASLAASAPIFQFGNLTPCESYFNIIASVFNLSAPHGVCAKNIKKSWKMLRTLKSTKEGRSWLTNEWKFCKPLETDKDFDILVYWLKDVYSNLAMTNYPYPTNFLASLPAYPIAVMCKRLSNPKLEDKELMKALGEAFSVYTNYTGTTKCLDIGRSASPTLGEQGWDFQACTEMVMPMCNEDNVMFEKEDWNLKKYSEDCKKKFGVTFDRSDIAILEYGGKTAPYSNIIFTNGLMDPWSAGGMLQSNIPSVYSILIPKAAHHLDLRASNPADPEDVRIVRWDIEKILAAWLDIYKKHS